MKKSSRLWKFASNNERASYIRHCSMSICFLTFLLRIVPEKRNCLDKFSGQIVRSDSFNSNRTMLESAHIVSVRRTS
jgi:hypothetical protein